MDHPLVEWLASLPSSLKVRGQEGKYLLKKSMEPYLPREIMYRPKQGFRRAPGAMVPGPLKAARPRIGARPGLLGTGWFNESYLRHLVDAHQSGARDYSAPAVDVADVRVVPPQRHGAARRSLVSGVAA
jgi:asparagine synthase (glutamine-hydrolysing)